MLSSPFSFNDDKGMFHSIFYKWENFKKSLLFENKIKFWVL